VGGYKCCTMREKKKESFKSRGKGNSVRTRPSFQRLYTSARAAANTTKRTKYTVNHGIPESSTEHKCSPISGQTAPNMKHRRTKISHMATRTQRERECGERGSGVLGRSQITINIFPPFRVRTLSIKARLHTERSTATQCLYMLFICFPTLSTGAGALPNANSSASAVPAFAVYDSYPETHRPKSSSPTRSPCRRR